MTTTKKMTTRLPSKTAIVCLQSDSVEWSATCDMTFCDNAEEAVAQVCVCGGGGGGGGGGIARWFCVGLASLLDAASWVRYSSGEIFSGRGDFSLGVSTGSDSIPHKLFWMRV